MVKYRCPHCKALIEVVDYEQVITKTGTIDFDYEEELDETEEVIQLSCQECHGLLNSTTALPIDIKGLLKNYKEK